MLNGLFIFLQITDTWLSKESLLSIVIPNISIELFTGELKLCSVFPGLELGAFSH